MSRAKTTEDRYWSDIAFAL